MSIKPKKRGINILSNEVKNDCGKNSQLDLLKRTFDSIQDLIVVIDKDFKIVTSNWKGCDSIAASEKQGHSYCYSCLMKRSKPCEPCYILEVFSTGNCRQVEMVDPLDGKTKIIELSPIFDEDHSVSMVVRHSKDISDRKNIEKILQMREQQQAAVAKLGQKGLAGIDLDLLMEKATELVAETLDVEYCRIMKHEKDGNQTMLAGVGWEKENEIEISNKDTAQNIFCYTLYSNDSTVAETNDKKESINAFSLLKDHGLVSGMDVLIGNRDNPFGAMNVHTTQQRLFTEDDIHFVQSVANVLAESISRKESEENLKHYAQELEKTTELKVLFTDILTHDLLNPANVIRGFTEELLILEDDKEKIPLLEKIHKNNERLIAMMESASKFIKLESIEDIKFDEKDIVPMVQRAVREYEHEARKKGVILELRPSCKCNTIVSPLIEEVFLNLISNAIKFSPANEKVIVSITDHDGECRVQVTDFGPGISSKDKAMIFERFRQADKGSVKGSGLGLAIVKRIMDLHNGKVGIDDNPLGKGSIFWVSVKKAV